MIALSTLFLIPFALGQNEPLPAKGDNGQLGGIFGISGPIPREGPANGPSTNPGISAKGTEFSLSKTRLRDYGSGPYKAKHYADPTIPGQTVYAPKTPVPGVKLPVMVWGNGGCTNSGTLFYDTLVEIASYGYLIIASGPPVADIPTEGVIEIDPMLDPYDAKFGKSKVQQMTDSVDWVMKGGASKYGEIDTTKIVAAGQSCGGLEAYSASYHDNRIKLTLVINSGLLLESQKRLLKELTAPVGYFLGGPKDAGYANGENDYERLPEKLPAMKASLDSGHSGTFRSTHGGKFGKAILAFLEWQFRNDAKAKLKFDVNSAESLVKDNWNVTIKNF